MYVFDNQQNNLKMGNEIVFFFFITNYIKIEIINLVLKILSKKFN